ncbi:unnamed protein product, partial [Timema podura]|nr:unnamed protein product [Timema podura]
MGMEELRTYHRTRAKERLHRSSSEALSQLQQLEPTMDSSSKHVNPNPRLRANFLSKVVFW